MNKKPTAAELAGLLESTRSFLEKELGKYYATKADVDFVGVTMAWTKTDYLASAASTTPSHVLKADITLWYEDAAPTTWVDYYIFMMTDILAGGTADYVLNYARKSTPQDSIFRSVGQFLFDFRVGA